MQSIRVRFGQTVRRLRTEAGISQEELADRCGLHRTYISDIELGKRNVSLDNIERIAKSFQRNIADLFSDA